MNHYSYVRIEPGFKLLSVKNYTQTTDVFLSLRDNGRSVCFSQVALQMLDSPEYISIYADESKKRLMVKRASKDDSYAFKPVQNGNTKYCIYSKSLAEKIREIFGSDIKRIYGHHEGDECGENQRMIFELDDN